ncbi:hypothetical protein PROFUN_00985 [Planoprotostelium fungivorum]|uniref:Uncharacterized protein n=1 Tax=Planoprotostelium fungivorum TaxID=1890364 RepID=A0A2P6N4F5_9EUKA|nr:hypothetical protein PROFUN_00985 [Planoprotostelium fungivorum]
MSFPNADASTEITSEDAEMLELDLLYKSSLRWFPSDGGAKERSGLPWGFCVTPLASAPRDTKDLLAADSVARCDNCFAYLNPYAALNTKKGRETWRCALCGELTTYDAQKQNGNRFALDHTIFETRVSAADTDNSPPIFLSIVDVSDTPGRQLSLSAIRDAINAQIEALPEGCLFGLITYADTVGIYDLKTSPPHILRIPVFNGDTGAMLRLEDVLPFSQLFVNVGEYKENIITAVDSLSASTSSMRALGTCLDLVLDFFQSHSMTKNNRTSLYVCGRPNYGRGLITADTEGDDISPSTEFYRHQAERAVDADMCIDVYLLKDSKEISSYGLSSYKFLSLRTGGNVRLYDTLEDVQVARDVYHQYNGTISFQGLLRARTSLGFGIQQTFGHFSADIEFRDLCRIPSCDPYSTLYFYLQFVSVEGMARNQEAYVQLAFAYTLLNREPDRPLVERRLRVFTSRHSVSRSMQKVHREADASTVLSLLTQKIIRSSLDTTFAEADLLLRDWVTILLTQQAEYVTKNMGNVNLPETTSDSLLSQLIRYVFGLSKNAIMRPDVDGDRWSFLHSLYSGLSPDLLIRCIYPQLQKVGFSDRAGRPLLFSSTQGSDDLILDSFSHIMIVHPDQQPPEQGGFTRREVARLKSQRPMTAKVSYFPSSSLDRTLFHMMLEEEGAGGEGYKTFTEQLHQEVLKMVTAKRDDDE